MKRFKNSKPHSDRRRGPPQQSSGPSTPRGRCVVGIHAVRELLQVRPRSVEQLWIRDHYKDHPDLVSLYELAKRERIKIHPHAPGALDKVASAHQGILAFSNEQPEIDWKTLETAENAVVLALDEVEDPHNLGAVLRTAWLFGAKGILVPEHRSADLSPAVSKVAQGAVEHVPVERDNSLPQQLERLKEMGFWIFGLSHKGSKNLFNMDLPKKVAWVLGSESGGLRKSVEGVCDELVAIPQSNPEASYNVSVAAAVAMAETFRQSLKN